MPPLGRTSALVLPLVLAAGLAGCARRAASPVPYVEVIPDKATGNVEVRIDGQSFTSYIHPASAKKPTGAAAIGTNPTRRHKSAASRALKQ